MMKGAACSKLLQEAKFDVALALQHFQAPRLNERPDTWHNTKQQLCPASGGNARSLAALTSADRSPTKARTASAGSAQALHGPSSAEEASHSSDPQLHATALPPHALLRNSLAPYSRYPGVH